MRPRLSATTMRKGRLQDARQLEMPPAAGTRAHEHASGSDARSEEHTSELQSLMRHSYAVFCLKKKTPNQAYQRSTAHIPRIHTVDSKTLPSTQTPIQLTHYITNP